MSDLPLITDSESWLDLKDGASATILGTVEASWQHSIVIRFADWSNVVVTVDDSNHYVFPVGEQIRLEVMRTEDGLYSTADDITNAMVEHGTI